MRTKRTPNLAKAICDRLAKGESLRAICRDPVMPGQTFVFEWLREDADFAQQYARAREEQADTLVDEIVEIADDASETTMRSIEKAKVRIDARKWAAGKMAPKKYGDKIGIEHSGTINLADALQAARKRVGK